MIQAQLIGPREFEFIEVATPEPGAARCCWRCVRRSVRVGVCAVSRVG